MTEANRGAKKQWREMVCLMVCLVGIWFGAARNGMFLKTLRPGQPISAATAAAALAGCFDV